MRIEVAAHQALETRAQLQEQARSIGISEEYVSVLVDAFYDKVRAHPELGPVFDEVILDHWPEHLVRMKLFWNSIALRTGTYRGNPMVAHTALTNAKPGHFPIWLDLFRQTLEETAPNPEVVDYFMGYADVMGERLSKAMFS
ncbi:MAG: group III truncated hemoglobin [Fimbriimonadaceae bacterium]|nr:group III truncated hemoglobin [Fimbriimonadaceae bacterium]